MAEIRWFGHNCFRIRAKEATVITDPVGKNTGFSMGKQTADIVTISHDHEGHTNQNGVKPEFQVIDGPGEYEMHDVFVTGVRTYHDNVKGAERGYNTAYVIELEGLRIAHLGDLGHRLTESQAEEFEAVDVMLVPVGNPALLTAQMAADLVTTLSPKSVIPMQFRAVNGDRTLEPVDEFVKALGVAMPEQLDKLVLRTSDLAEEETKLFLLAPDR